MNQKINNKQAVADIYLKSFPGLSKNQRAVLLHQLIYKANQYYIPTRGYTV